MAQVNRRQSRAHVSAEVVAKKCSNANDSNSRLLDWRTTVVLAGVYTQSVTRRVFADSVALRGASRGSGGWQHQHSGPHGQLS
jgi:hypothetical protein